MNDLTELTPIQKEVISQYIQKIRDGNKIPLIGPKEISQLVMNERKTKYQSQNEIQSFSKPRAYVIFQELEKENILKHIPRKGFELTDEGRRITNELIHRTELLETYFYQELGLPLEIAEKDAQNTVLEVSIDLISSICDILGQPKYCPHGYTIPHNDLN